jgi:DNA-binding CsgD family transcriptional regulator
MWPGRALDTAVGNDSQAAEQQADLLLERSGELQTLRELARGAASGAGSVCLIDGAAGTGKTTLLAACRDLCEAAGLRPLAARPGSLERELPWNVVRQLFSPVIAAPSRDRNELLAGAARLSAPALGLSAGADEDALHGLYWLTTSLARDTPLLIAVDDAHWGDLPSLRYLAYMAERVSELAVLLVVSSRLAEDDRPPLRALAARADSHVLALRELSATASAELVRSTMGRQAPDELCAACHEATHGNPFLLSELLAQIRREGVDAGSGGGAAVAGVTPPAITRSLLLRLSRLGPSAIEVANALALLGTRAELHLVASVAGLDGVEAAGAADVLAAANILTPGRPLEFIHPIVREVIYAELPRHDRSRRHGDAARVLAQVGASPESVAAQLLEAEAEGDEWAVARLQDAARQALDAGAPSAAVEMLERALVEPPPAPRRSQVLFELGLAQARGTLAGTDRMREALATAADPHERAEIGLALGHTLGFAGRHTDAVDVLAQALIEPHDDRELRLRLEAEMAGHCLHAANRLSLGFERLAEVDVGRPPSQPAERLLQLMAAFALTASGRIEGSRARDIALGAAEEYPLFRQETSALVLFVAETLMFAGYLDDAGTVLDAMLAEARGRGSRPRVALASAFRSQVALRRGAVAEAEADGRTAFEVVDPQVLGYCRPYALSFLCDALVERDQLAEAEALLDSAGPSERWPELAQFGFLIGSRGRLRLAQGRAAEAAADLRECGRRLAPWRPRNPLSVPWRSDAALALAMLGERAEARRLATWELDHARAASSPRGVGVALRSLGVAEGGSRGVDLLRDSASELERANATLELTKALIELGAMIRRSGSKADARAPLRRAIELARRCGATAAARRGSEELKATGVRLSGAVGGLESLTASELRVARMASEGRTNREIAEALFVSLRTVETHLTHAYQKLEIRSRSQLGSALGAGDPG